ncbi:MAG: DUF4398 domain-containing protein [Treponema sp.]|jgi:hypothetical protein|nr:DUF4398 domain-containing protein [Treponema sp.]
MKRNKIHLFCALLILPLVMGACAKPPVEEMNNAQDAVTRAENDADAVFYAGSALARARDALNRMQTEADAKRYDAAKSYAAEAVAAADKAIADGRAGAARARNEAAALIAGLKPALTETGQGLKAAQSARLALDFASLNRDFEAARLSAEQAEIALSGNQYQDAIDKGNSARAGLSDINQKLSEAASAISRKK